MKKLKPKDRIEQACKRAVERYDEKQRQIKAYWDKKIEEAKGNK